ncbi:MAG: ATP-binding protein [Nitrospiraceae bacterium]|nr:ATP-binding protein [Nitrospiraceae bacterium]
MTDMNLMNTAFDTFTKASRSLEAYYEALQQQIVRLTVELQKKNQELNAALADAEKNKGYLNAILYSLEEAIIVVDGDERVTMMNKSAVELLGLGESAVTGKKYSECGLFFQLSTNASGSTLKANGRQYNVIVSRSPIMDSTGEARGLVIQIKDITRMREMETLHERNKRLISLGEMAAKIVHEIRNPLCSIELFSSMLENDLEDKRLKDLAKGISSGIHSLDNIVTNMLFFAKPHKPALEKLRLDNTVKDALGAVEPFIKSRNIRLAGRFSRCVVRGDAELLKQVIMNIAINAVQAMPGGGEIAVEMRRTEDAATVDIRDSGEGIDPSNLEKIFDPFFSTKEKGTGLGLAITSKIMQAHGGYIKVSSEKGKGSTFSLHFPKTGG